MPQPAQQPGWLDGLYFNIGDAFDAGDAAGAAMGGASSGQGFTMSRDDAMAMLKVAKTVRADFRDMRDDAYRLTQTTSPADEPTSNGYNKRLVNEGEPKGVFVAGKDQVDQEFAYADELVKRLEKALGITESSDEQAATDVKYAGKQSGGFA
ncbi:hypothetical protein [Amycolatopsis echigonensis]|uniref:Uncharacterized protein n=1 Tax=Amycolatopsis echigonensis TaxID=2576905 RepID=A0A8E1W0V2_9PSEU|nr:hypothetical protein [Amycolatopsis echigonensis]MBB2501733.1 hypothetical protein [Amycolatopsis echigonensis]